MMSTPEGYRQHTLRVPVTKGTVVADPVQLEVTTSLSHADLHAIAVLVERATELDGARPLSDHVMLHLLADSHDGFLHICAWQGAQLVGYACIDRTDSSSGPSVEIAVDAAGRDAGVDAELLDEALKDTSGQLQLWAHGQTAAAADLARSRGFSKVRELHLMRRSLGEDVADFTPPPRFTIRPFDLTKDVEPWLDLNARAFADLPDQGGWTRRDLELRMAEDWFDPAGFLLAHDITADGDEGALVGFHWTKVHRNGGSAGPGQDPIGEVYVLGVDPQLHGKGIGRTLTLAGLHHLWNQGLRDVVLYVDSNNMAALATYERLGFRRFDTDALYRSPIPPRPTA